MQGKFEKSRFRRPSGFSALTAALLLASPAPATQVFGTLGNFDAVNDTGQTAHGFEIDLEDISKADVTDTFGGAGRGFPTTVERYGAPTITNTTFADGHTGVAIVYSGTFNAATNSWDVGTPFGAYSTPGESCWTGGGSGYGPSTPCDHFGVGTTKNATKTTYTWLTEDPAHPGALVGMAANIPAPVQVVTPQAPPAPGAPPPPPMVQGVVRSLDPANGFQFGVPEWVKVFTIQYDHPVALEDLVVGQLAGLAPHDAAEVETEWYLLQTERGNANSGVLESADAEAGGGAESVLRRYEFYKYSGTYQGSGTTTYDGSEVSSENPVEAGPGKNIGDFIGAQNLGVNLNGVYVAPAVPEPSTWLLLGLGFASLGAYGSTRRRAQPAA